MITLLIIWHVVILLFNITLLNNNEDQYLILRLLNFIPIINIFIIFILIIKLNN